MAGRSRVLRAQSGEVLHAPTGRRNKVWQAYTKTFPVSNAYGFDQRAIHFLDRRGWRDRDFQRGMGIARKLKS